MLGLGGYLRRHHVALLALFVALGGTSYAAVRLPANSVGSPQIKNRSIQQLDLKKKTVASLKGRRGLQGPQGLQGPRGLQGIKGTKGDPGAQGPPGPTAGFRLGGITPPASPLGTDILATSATTTVAAKLFVIAALSGSITCGAGACSQHFGLYVDGQPVPGTEVQVGASANSSAKADLTSIGVSSVLPAATHHIRMYHWYVGPWMSAGGSSNGATVVTLGS